MERNLSLKRKSTKLLRSWLKKLVKKLCQFLKRHLETLSLLWKSEHDESVVLLSPGEMTVTVSLQAAVCGTELSVVQEGIPAVIPLEACHLGWQESLVALAQLVEPDIPG